MAAMCVKCDGFKERLNFPTPREYRVIAGQLIDVVNQGTFWLVHADCPLEEILEEPYLPGDLVRHDFQCTTCGHSFQLFADTYHGNAHWSAI